MLIACDESGTESSDNYFVIGAIFVDENLLGDYEKRVFQLRLVRKCWGELHWSEKVKDSSSKNQIDTYKEFIKLSLTDFPLRLRFVIVDKSKLNLKQFHKNDQQLMQFKFMYFTISRYVKTLLSCKLINQKEDLYILFDEFTQSKVSMEEKRVLVAREWVEKYTGMHVSHIQPCDSKVCSILQLCDLLTSAVSTKVNGKVSCSAKLDLINYIEKLLNRQLNRPSAITDTKVNVWFWNPGVRAGS